MFFKSTDFDCIIPLKSKFNYCFFQLASSAAEASLR